MLEKADFSGEKRPRRRRVPKLVRAGRGWNRDPAFVPAEEGTGWREFNQYVHSRGTAMPREVWRAGLTRLFRQPLPWLCDWQSRPSTPETGSHRAQGPIPSTGDGYLPSAPA